MKIRPEDVTPAINHSGLSPEEVAARLSGARELRWGEHCVTVESKMVGEARAHWLTLSGPQREAVRANAEAALDDGARRIAAGSRKKRVMDAFVADLCMWYAGLDS